MPDPTFTHAALLGSKSLTACAALCGTDCTLFVCSLIALLSSTGWNVLGCVMLCDETACEECCVVLCSQDWCDTVTAGQLIACCSAGSRLTQPLVTLYLLQVHLSRHNHRASCSSHSLT